MPCTVCTSQLIFLNDIPMCPKCKNLSIVPHEDSLIISEYYINLFKRKFENIIKIYKKNDLLLGIFWQREKEIIKFNEVYSTLNLSTLRSSTLLLRRIIKVNDFSEKQKPTQSDIETIIDAYSKLLDGEENKSKLGSGTSTMINTAKYDLDNLDDFPQNGIKVCPNEKYGRVMDAFAKHNIMSKKDAEEKVKKLSKDVRYVEPGSKKINTTKETIETFYELISTLYTAFLRNTVCKEAFQMPEEKLVINPINIKRLLGRYILTHDKSTEIDYSLFREDIIMIFKRDYKKIISNFVLSEDNVNAMPIFLRIDDKIFVSQTFGELYCYFLHALINKDEFDVETERRSKIYEQKITRQHFENLSFRYFNSFKVKNKMEIDGIAISENQIYVIEVKGWGSQKLLEEKSSQDILTREIKNAINGIHVDRKNNKIKHKVSLKQKIDWVNSNRNLFKIKKDTPIRGMLIINEPPTINEYKDCKIEFINDFLHSQTGSRIMEEGLSNDLIN